MGKRNEVIEIMAKNEGVTISQLAQAINKPSANLYDIQSGKLKGVSNKLADALIDRFPQYSKSWLLTGEGSMLWRLLQQLSVTQTDLRLRVCMLTSINARLTKRTGRLLIMF